MRRIRCRRAKDIAAGGRARRKCGGPDATFELELVPQKSTDVWKTQFDRGPEFEADLIPCHSRLNLRQSSYEASVSGPENWNRMGRSGPEQKKRAAGRVAFPDFSSYPFAVPTASVNPASLRAHAKPNGRDLKYLDERGEACNPALWSAFCQPPDRNASFVDRQRLLSCAPLDAGSK